MKESLPTTDTDWVRMISEPTTRTGPVSADDQRTIERRPAQRSLFEQEENSTSTQEAWNILEARFGNNSTLGALNAIQEIFSIKQDSMSVSEYIAKIQKNI